MKKLTAILLTLSLMLTMLCTPALAEEDDELYIFTDTQFVSLIEYSVDEWLDNDAARAMLVTLLGLDINTRYKDNATFRTIIGNSMDNGEVFLALDCANQLLATYVDTDYYLCAVYDPASDEVAVGMSPIDVIGDVEAYIQSAINDGVFIEYYAVPRADISAFLTALQNQLAGD